MSMKTYRNCLIIIFVVSVIFTGYFTYRIIDSEIPDEVNAFSEESVNITSSLPVSYSADGRVLETSAVTENGELRHYSVTAKLFGIIPVKKVDVNIIPDTKLIPCGLQIGIYLHTNGVMVIDTGDVTDINGNKSCPAENIIKADDYIVSLNGMAVCTKSQLTFLINKYGNEDIVLGINRNGELINVRVTPVCTGANQYMAGIWVRDDSQGIGTLTYVTEDGHFGGLGHGISDVDTGMLLSSNEGILYSANIWGIKKGESGNPGGLLGSIVYEKDNEYGEILKNTGVGIFGEANNKLLSECENEAMEVGLINEIEKGKAYIRCMLDDEMTDYEIEIQKIDYSNSKKNKGMVIEITDERLLDKTNGIVQGMSGSPIIQNGKIIGAVTHVFVDDPTKGYGIFIENMIAESMK